MKRSLYLSAAALLCMFLLAACAPEEAPPPEPTPTPEGAVATCRIADGAGESTLLLAELDGSIMRLGTSLEEIAVTLDGQPASAADLRDGMLVDVQFSGTVLESYPGQYYQVTALEAHTKGLDDRCGLYLQVLEDLWGVDSGLNSDIEMVGLDLSGLTDLTAAEREAVAWRFMELRGLELVQGTWDELVEEGYIDGEALYWDKGCFFSISGSAEEGFDAEKWRSGLGAYFFVDCTAREEGGSWSYEVGSEAIS